MILIIHVKRVKRNIQKTSEGELGKDNIPIRFNCGTVARTCVQIAWGQNIINWSHVYDILGAKCHKQETSLYVLPPTPQNDCPAVKPNWSIQLDMQDDHT